MSKKTQAKNTPEIYMELGTNVNRPHICIMEDNMCNISLFNSLQNLEKLQSFSDLIKPSINKLWKNFDTFTQENKQTILTYHDNLFGKAADKDQDIVITAMYCWNKFILTAKNDLTTLIPTQNGRKSTIGTCEYRIGTITEGEGQLKTPQAKACLKLFRECIKDQEMVTETVMRQYVEDHAAELHTRQDPWRIFQYYRPLLIAEKLITRK